MTRSKDRRAWEQRDEESAKQFALFARYRDLGPIDRTVKQVAEDSSFSYGYLSRLSRQYDWQDRAEAYDRWQDRRQQQLYHHARKQARLDLLDRLDELLEQAIDIALGRTDRVAAGQGKMIRDLLDRLGLNEPQQIDLDVDADHRHEGEISTGEGSGPSIDVSSLGPERLRTLLEIVREAKGEDDD